MEVGMSDPAEVFGVEDSQGKDLWVLGEHNLDSVRCVAAAGLLHPPAEPPSALSSYIKMTSPTLRLEHSTGVRLTTVSALLKSKGATVIWCKVSGQPSTEMAGLGLCSVVICKLEIS